MDFDFGSDHLKLSFFPHLICVVLSLVEIYTSFKLAVIFELPILTVVHNKEKTRDARALLETWVTQ